MKNLALVVLIALLAATASPASAQRVYEGIPVVKEGTTVRISPHVYVIPDESARGVPNVGMGDASILTAYHGYFTALRARVAELKREGKSSDETAVTLRNEFRAKYPDWDQPLRVHAAATAVYAELP